jgi:hypothetical protein
VADENPLNSMSGRVGSENAPFFGWASCEASDDLSKRWWVTNGNRVSGCRALEQEVAAVSEGLKGLWVAAMVRVRGFRSLAVRGFDVAVGEYWW